MLGNTRVYGSGLREPAPNLLDIIGELRQLLAAAEGKVAQLERQLVDRNQRLAVIGSVCHVDMTVSAAKVVITARRSRPTRLPGISAARRLAEGTGEHETRRSADDFDFGGDTEVVDPETLEAFR